MLLSIILIGLSAVLWTLVNNILMPTLWDVASKSLKSVLKALTSELKRKEDEKK